MTALPPASTKPSFALQGVESLAVRASNETPMVDDLLSGSMEDSLENMRLDVDKGAMVESDQFMGKDGSLLKRDSEGSTQWLDLAAEEVFQVM